MKLFNLSCPLASILFLACLSASLPLFTASSQESRNAVVSPVDTFMVLVAVRPIDEIKQDIEVLDALRSRKKAQLDELNAQKQRGEAEIDQKAKEISLLESRQDVAEKENKDGDVAALKSQIEGVKRIHDLLKERQGLFSTEIDAAEAALDYAKAAEEMFDREIALAKKRQELSTQAGAGGSKSFVAGSNRALLDQENAVLEAQVEKLKRQEKMLSEERDVVKAQQSLAEMQGRLLPK
jgi:hypothetical protein